MDEVDGTMSHEPSLDVPGETWWVRSELDQDRNRWQVVSRWAIIGSRLEPVEMRVEPRPERRLLTDEVRRLPLGRVLAGARVELAGFAGRLRAQHNRWGDDFPVFVPDAAVDAGPRRGSRMGEAVLNEVARVYRSALFDGRSVNRAVQEEFSLTQGGAAKRIAAARRAGLLPDLGSRR